MANLKELLENPEVMNKEAEKVANLVELTRHKELFLQMLFKTEADKKTRENFLSCLSNLDRSFHERG